MTKFKIGDKVRLLKSQSVAINSETGVPFKKKDITTITDFLEYNNNPSLTFVRLGEGKDGRINIVSLNDLELVEDENKTYTKEDIYAGMVLECVYKENDTFFWKIGKQYIVDKNLCIYDEGNEKRDITQIVDRLNNPNEHVVKFKVVEPEEEPLLDDKLTHLHSVVITVPKKNASGSYVNYNGLLTYILADKCIVNLSKCDRLVNIDESVEYISIEVLNEDLVYLAKSFNFPINELRNLNQTKLDLQLNGQHFVLDIQEEMDYSTTLINGLIGNI